MTFLEDEAIRRVAELDYNWSKLENKTILISGGTGFLGQFLIQTIKYRNENYNDNINIISLSRNPFKNEDNITYIQRDITKDLDITSDINFIIHLASNTHPVQYASDPVGTILTNVLGCNNLLKLAVNKKTERFLLASSVEIYGEGNGNSISEEYSGYINCNTARAGYNEAKRVSESLCQSYRMQFGLDCVTARLARCFGPDKKTDSKAMAQFMSNAVSGEDIVLKSKGEQRFSYCYVADAVSGLIKILIDGLSGEAYNVADDDEGKSLKDYASIIAGFANKKVVISADSQVGASNANYAIIDCTKLKNLGWRPLFSVSEGLAETFKIYKEKQ